MKLSRNSLRALIDSVITESTASGRKSFARSQVKKVHNKDMNKAEKVMNKIKGADWNAGYEAEVVAQDEAATGIAALTPVGQAINKFLPSDDTKYGVMVTGFSQQDEADDFSEIIRRELNVLAISLKDEKSIIVDPARDADSYVAFRMGASGLDYKP